MHHIITMIVKVSLFLQVYKVYVFSIKLQYTPNCPCIWRRKAARMIQEWIIQGPVWFAGTVYHKLFKSAKKNTYLTHLHHHQILKKTFSHRFSLPPVVSDVFPTSLSWLSSSGESFFITSCHYCGEVTV